MWPFSNRGPRLDVEEEFSNHNYDFDFTPYKSNDASIKLWVPDKILTSIDGLSLNHKVSRPDTLRWILFEHTYGRDLFIGLCSYAESLKIIEDTSLNYSLKKTDDEIPRFNRKDPEKIARSINQRFLGKATEDVKLWLPKPLKVTLKELADNKGNALSDYLRSVLVRHLFGEQFYAKWQQALADINKQAIQYENQVYQEGEEENFINPPVWS